LYSADCIITEPSPDILTALDNSARLFSFACQEGNCPKYALSFVLDPKAKKDRKKCRFKSLLSSLQYSEGKKSPTDCIYELEKMNLC
jgi:hypothetical protein